MSKRSILHRAVQEDLEWLWQLSHRVSALIDFTMGSDQQAVINFQHSIGKLDGALRELANVVDQFVAGTTPLANIQSRVCNLGPVVLGAIDHLKNVAHLFDESDSPHCAKFSVDAGTRFHRMRQHYIEAITDGESFERKLSYERGEDRSPEAGAFIPTQGDQHILQALARATMTLIQAQIAEESGEATRTVKKRLPKLEQAGLVNRPHGKRKGYAITDAGRQLLT